MTDKKSLLPNLKILPYGGAGAIHDKEMLSFIKHIDVDLIDILDNADVTNQFILQYQEWIKKTTVNQFIGLEQFSYPVYTNATTETFDKFYMANNQRRFRCFKGEYMYHQLAWRNFWPNWSYISDDLDVDVNDAVVISLPFADTGNPHNLHTQLLNLCTELNVPVLLDCAYANISGGLTFDLTYPCITDIAFSLSKFVPLGANARIGMRCTKTDTDDPIFVLNKTNYTNRFGAWLGLKIIQKFHPDYIYKTYRQQQLKFCSILDAEPSRSVIFGLGNKNYNQYNRGAGNNRLCFFQYLHNGKLPS